MRFTHLAYVQAGFGKLLLTIIPVGAKLSPNSTIKESSVGKVPGTKNPDGTWSGFGWGALGEISEKRAARWDRNGAAIGFRTGIDGHVGLDVDLTDPDLEAPIQMSFRKYGLAPLTRRVEDRDHHKFLLFFRIIDSETGLPYYGKKRILVVVQKDGTIRRIELLVGGQYFNVHGIHNGTLTPYVWDVDPLDFEVPTISSDDFEKLWAELPDALLAAGAQQVTARLAVNRSTGYARTIQKCTIEELEAIMQVLKNDEAFVDRQAWVDVAHYMYAATNGNPAAREIWIDWTNTAPQRVPEEAGRIWDTINPSELRNSGYKKLRDLARELQPEAFATLTAREVQDAFDDYVPEPGMPDLPPDEPPEDSPAKRILNSLDDFAYSASDNAFFHISQNRVLPPAGFENATAPIQNDLRALWGGAKGPFIKLFCQNRPDRIFTAFAHFPGRPRELTHRGCNCFNMWRPIERPLQGEKLDEELLDFYIEHCRYIFQSYKIALLWLKWNAFLLQYPHEQPGWHWIIMGNQGIGKDLMARPFTIAHSSNGGYIPLQPSVFRSAFNDYATGRYLTVSELKQMSGAHDTYNTLKDLASQNEFITINAKNQRPYQAMNVAALIMFSNELVPIFMESGDRRFYVTNRLGLKPKSAAYYTALHQTVTTGFATIVEYCARMKLTTRDLALLRGHAPGSRDKANLARATMSEMTRGLYDIRDALEMDNEVSWSPVFTASQMTKWIKDLGYNTTTVIPGHLLYSEGFRPVVSEKSDPTSAGSYKGKRLWHATAWLDKTGRIWDLNNVRPEVLFQLYKTGKVGPASLEDEADEEEEI